MIKEDSLHKFFKKQTLKYSKQKKLVLKDAIARLVSRGSYDAAAIDVEIDPQSCRFRRSQTNFALEAIVERRAAVAKRIAVLLRWQSEVGEVRRGLPVGL